MRAAAGRVGLRVATLAVVAFLHIPILIIALFAFNADRGQSWPIRTWTTRWFADAAQNLSLRSALVLSIEAALIATTVALVLGTLAAIAVQRYRFFGRESVSFLLVLPLALPGIVTGMALNATINTAGIPFSLLTIVAGHATFCIVVVYNNVLARLRRMSRSIDEASYDLGADSAQTFRYITFPIMRGALLAGALLAFALSFDEVIVTTFTAGTEATLPIWILDNLRQANQRPIVNVVALVIVLLTAIPIYVSQRLGGEESGASVL
jgi:putative spermidine/putrescine transport system permease protein